MNESNVSEGNSMPPTSARPIKFNKLKSKKSAMLGLLVVAIISAIVMGVLWQKEASKIKEKNDAIATLESSEKEKSNRISELEEELEKRKETTGEADIKEDQYQSVFLKNGQVYFGKITKITESKITLEDIYYLSSETSTPTLVKLGEELHGPEDVMFIERKEVQFWENLKKDGRVAKAIENYVKSQQ